jgi:hypothetical protein
MSPLKKKRLLVAGTKKSYQLPGKEGPRGGSPPNQGAAPLKPRRAFFSKLRSASLTSIGRRFCMSCLFLQLAFNKAHYV